MKKLFFEISLKGHRMEYLHHIYMGMAERREDDFVIVIPDDFKDKASLYEWPKADNVRFLYLKKEEIDRCEGGLIKGAWRRTQLLRRYVNKENANSVFLITLMEFIPFLPLLISRKVNVVGIIYMIYLYRWKDSSWKTRISDVIKYLFLSGNNCIKTAFILNDAPAARKLNSIFHTDKFCFITDPYNPINYKPRNIREELGIGVGQTFFLHFGGLTRRKGTLTILEALEHIPDAKLSEKTFVFAGRVYDGIRKEFYRLINEKNHSAKIIVFDKFCSNEQLADLCYSCDFILAPYSDTMQSSGILGHAASFNKPVIGPSTGLIGKLIRRNKLGLVVEDMTPRNLADVIVSAKQYNVGTSYKQKISIDSFTKIIFEKF